MEFAEMADRVDCSESVEDVRSDLSGEPDRRDRGGPPVMIASAACQSSTHPCISSSRSRAGERVGPVMVGLEARGVGSRKGSEYGR